ncbi:MAG: CpsB/CapC family capsule biosynthesis tyrosine phosphatase [Bacillota bacterium]|nr:CpsB/CapC family capsule biosynthesis tyrosine phosphatase [Bacillota bacterium]
MIDFHNHILPGIDDGAKDWDEFFAMIEIAAAEGIAQIVCTPHYICGEVEYNISSYNKLLEEARERLAARNIAMKLIPGNEVFFSNEIVPALAEGKLITVNNQGKHLLIEFPMMDVPSYTQDILFELKLKGVTPIIAHPERNHVLSNNGELLAKLIEAGCLCQLNSGSITGLFGESTKRAAISLVQSGMVHLLGTDAHSPRRRGPKVKEAMKLIFELAGAARGQEIIEVNPLKIINGLEVEPYPIELIQEKRSLWGWLVKSLKASSQ